MPALAPQNALPCFTMLLSLLDDEVNIDRAALKQAGVRKLRSIRSAHEALRIVKAALAPRPAFKLDFIVCADAMPPMAVNEFLRALSTLAEGSATQTPPVLFIAPDQQSLNLALAHGATAALARPYSINELAAAVAKLHNQAEAVASGASAEAPAASKADMAVVTGMLFSAQAKKAGAALGQRVSAEQSGTVGAERATALAVAAQVVKADNSEQQSLAAKKAAAAPQKAGAKTTAAAPQKAGAKKNAPEPMNKLLYSRTGLKMLREGKLASAQEFLLKALRFDALDMEAALGLARLYRETGNEERVHRWMHKAGVICLQCGQPERAEGIFCKLPSHWQGDHYLIEAQNLLLDEEFDQACEALMQLSALQGKKPHELLGRACQLTSAPEYFIGQVCAALERNGYGDTAVRLEKRMLDDAPVFDMRPYGFLSHFPLLQEVVTIARFTMRAWRTSEV